MAILKVNKYLNMLLLSYLLFIASNLGAVHSAAVKATDNSLAGLLCTRGNDWINPHWLATSKTACPSTILELELDKVQGLPNILHQFVGPERVEPEPGVPIVQTPYKIQRGGCTLAITTLKSLTRDGLPPTPEIGLGPFPDSDLASWHTLLRYAGIMWQDCIDHRRPMAGVYASGIMEGLGLFMYASGSMMDHKIGLGVNVLTLPYHGNVTGNAFALRDGLDDA